MDGSDLVIVANRGPASFTRGDSGELVLAAIGGGARRITVCVGGSATTDGGLGAVEVLEGRLSGIELTVACDVTTPFTRAAADFAGQKGASAAQVAMLERRLERLVQVYRDRFGRDVSILAGAGAGGGLAGGLAALGANLVRGFDLVAEAVDLADQVGEADLVVTGEGFLDRQSFDGKVVGGMVELCSEASVPLVIVAGQVLEDIPVPAEGVEVLSLSDLLGLDASLGDPLGSIRSSLRRDLAGRRRGPPA